VADDEVSRAVEEGLGAVRAAVHRCTTSQGLEAHDAQRELGEVLVRSVAAAKDLARGGSPHADVVRRGVSDMVKLAKPWLTAEFVFAHRVRMSTEEVAELLRRTWLRTEVALHAFREADGDQRARARVRELVDGLSAVRTASARGRGPALSERQAMTWELGVDEMIRFATEALARA
jgi:hypothetical protein